jgi:SAM-dependent methyltransferase
MPGLFLWRQGNVSNTPWSGGSGMTDAGFPKGYGRERLSPRNIDSCLVRRTLATAVSRAAAEWKASIPGGTVLDVGCGSQPYRALLEAAGLRYTGIDWPQSIHQCDIRDVVRADLSEFPWPLGDAATDAILCTEVLEHQPEPAGFLRECARVLRPGGCILLTTPFVWPEHERPHDYYRYTRHGLEHLFGQTGLDVDGIQPRGGWHLTQAQMLGLWSYYGVGKPWNYLTRLAVLPVMFILAALDRGEDSGCVLPVTLGYSVRAHRPAAG